MKFCQSEPLSGFKPSQHNEKTTPKGGFCGGRETDQARLESTALKVWLGHMTALSLSLAGR